MDRPQVDLDCHVMVHGRDDQHNLPLHRKLTSFLLRGARFASGFQIPGLVISVLLLVGVALLSVALADLSDPSFEVKLIIFGVFGGVLTLCGSCLCWKACRQYW